MPSTSTLLMSLLLLLPASSWAARDGNPCESDGSLKGWAKSKYPSDYCSDSNSSSTDSDTIASICDSGKLKGWARKQGFTSADCSADTTTDTSTDTSTDTPTDTPIDTFTPRQITLSWQPPSQRANGEPLLASEISAYEIYVIDNEGNHSEIIRIGNSQVLSLDYTLNQPGIYHFAIVSEDMTGLQSTMSEVVSTTAE